MVHAGLTQPEGARSLFAAHSHPPIHTRPFTPVYSHPSIHTRLFTGRRPSDGARRAHTAGGRALALRRPFTPAHLHRLFTPAHSHPPIHTRPLTPAYVQDDDQPPMRAVCCGVVLVVSCVVVFLLCVCVFVCVTCFPSNTRLFTGRRPSHGARRADTTGGRALSLRHPSTPPIHTVFSHRLFTPAYSHPLVHRTTISLLFTETEKHSPNTGALTNNTLQVIRPPH